VGSEMCIRDSLQEGLGEAKAHRDMLADVANGAHAGR
jgi:hypothetical protein